MNTLVCGACSRGSESSQATGTTTSVSSTSISAVASARSISSATFTSASIQPSSTAVNNIGNPSSASSDSTPVLSASPDPSLQLVFGIVVTSILSVSIIIGVLCYKKIQQRRKSCPRRRVTFGKNCDAVEISTGLKRLDAVANRMSTKDILFPQVVALNGSAQEANPNPSCVIQVYNVIVKDSCFAQIGSGNTMTVSEQIVKNIWLTHDSNSEGEEQLLCAAGSLLSGDIDSMTINSSLSRCTSGGKIAFCLPGQGAEFPAEGNLRQGSTGKSNTSAKSAEALPSRSLSASRSGEEQYRAPQATLELAEASSVPCKKSVSPLKESSKLAGLCYQDQGSGTDDSSSKPSENTDYSCQAMAASSKPSPASLLLGGTESNSISEPLHSPPCDNECRTPSEVGQFIADAVVPVGHASSSRFNSRLGSMDCAGDNESVPPLVLQNLSACKPGRGKLPTGDAVHNLDDDAALPTSSTENLPLLSLIQNSD